MITPTMLMSELQVLLLGGERVVLQVEGDSSGGTDAGGGGVESASCLPYPIPPYP